MPVDWRTLNWRTMDATPEQVAFLLAIGVATGVAGAVLGTGGGVFLIPLLVLGLGLPMHIAVGTSILSVIATSTAVAAVNVERGTANMRLGMTLEIATSLGAITGGLTAAWLPAYVLETVFAVVLLPTAVLMWRGKTENETGPAASASAARPGSAAEPGRLGGRYTDEQIGREVIYRVRRLWAGLCVSCVAGIMSGLLGIGGGVFKVPALDLFCGVPIKAAAATSNFMIGVTAAASASLLRQGGSATADDRRRRAGSCRRLGDRQLSQPADRRPRSKAHVRRFAARGRRANVLPRCQDLKAARMTPHQKSNRLAWAVHISLLSGLVTSAALLVIGAVLVLVSGQSASDNPPGGVTTLLSKAAKGDGTAILQLGLLVLMLTPVARVVVLAVGWLVDREWRFAFVALFVFALLMTSLILGTG